MDRQGNLLTTITSGITIVFTHKCNRNCAFCIDKNARKLVGDGFISIDSIDKAILFAKEKNLTTFYITGGEPTLHPDFIEIIKRIYDNGFAVRINTNYDYPEVLRRVAAFIEKIYISYYGQNNLPKANVLENVKIQLRMIVSRYNFKTIQELDDFIDRHKGKHYSLHLVMIRPFNAYCIDGVVDFADTLSSKNVKAFDDKGVELVLYRGVKVHRFDLPRDPNRTDISYKVHVDGTIALDYEDIYEETKGLALSALHKEMRSNKNPEARRRIMSSFDSSCL